MFLTWQGTRPRFSHDDPKELGYAGTVVKAWTEYIKDASHATPPDRWLPLAQSHLARAERDRKAAYERWRRAAPGAPKADLTK